MPQRTPMRGMACVMGAMDVVGYEMGQHWAAAARFIRAAREAGGRCLVHCAAGMNRSGFVAATELLLHSRLPVLEAVTRLRLAYERREGWCCSTRASSGS